MPLNNWSCRHIKSNSIDCRDKQTTLPDTRMTWQLRGPFPPPPCGLVATHLKGVENVSQLVPLKVPAKAHHHAAEHGGLLLQRLQSPPFDAQPHGHVPNRYFLHSLRRSDTTAATALSAATRNATQTQSVNRCKLVEVNATYTQWFCEQGKHETSAADRRRPGCRSISSRETGVCPEPEYRWQPNDGFSGGLESPKRLMCFAKRPPTQR